jgi:hypothetical protein
VTNEERVERIIQSVKDPAFPSVVSIESMGVAEGLTKHEWIATNLLSALVSNLGLERAVPLRTEITPDTALVSYVLDLTECLIDGISKRYG